MVTINPILVDYDTFLAWFPYFNGKITEDSLDAAYEGAKSYISVNYGEIILPPDMQKRGVYLATAHQMFLNLNPDKAMQGKLASATEGSVSAGFVAPPQYKSWLEYWLSLSPYGLELLAILDQIQPPTPDKPINVYPYYEGVNIFGW